VSAYDSLRKNVYSIVKETTGKITERHFPNHERLVRFLGTLPMVSFTRKKIDRWLMQASTSGQNILAKH
jgi:hypothetical protein